MALLPLAGVHAPDAASIWDEVRSVQPEPERGLVIATALLAALAVFAPGLWYYTRYAVTIAHEGGHGLVAVLTGRRLEGIRLHSDTSGLTLSVGKPRGPGMVATSAAGYLTPALLGLASAGLLAVDRITALLWIDIVLLAALAVMVRNVYGWLLMLAIGAAFFAVSLLASTQTQAGFAYLVAWFLLIAAPKPVFELQRRRRRGRARHSDADQLAAITGVGGLAWVCFFAVICLGALALGGYWLLLP
ncbi:MAG: M50 family metallopeptidase [Sciscionella sp.]